jgi:hypothetical protein
MTGTDSACLHTNQSQSYLNHLVFTSISAFPEHIPCAVLSILIDLIIPTILHITYYETLSYEIPCIFLQLPLSSLL